MDPDSVFPKLKETLNTFKKETQSVDWVKKIGRVIFISTLVFTLPVYLCCKFVGMTICIARIGFKEGWNSVTNFNERS